MSNDLILTIIILIVTTLLFINGRLRSDLVAAGSLLALILTGIITVPEALAGFSNSVVIMIAGLFIVGAGIFRTGLAKMIGNQLLRLAGESQTKLLIVVMLVTAVFSGIISNTGTVAVLLPVVMGLALHINVSPSKFLIPLAYASSLGGVLTLIGTPPNLVVSQALSDYGYEKLTFFDFTPIGLIALVCGLLFMLTIGKRILPDQKGSLSNPESLSAEKLAGIYKVQNQLHRVQVSSASKAIHKTIKELRIGDQYGLTVVEVERKTKDGLYVLPQKQHMTATPDTTIEAEDILLVLGSENRLQAFMNDLSLSRVDKVAEDLTSRQFGITEILITPQSKLLNKSIKEIHLREKYKLNILAVNRRGDFVNHHLADIKLRFGDSLLVHGNWEDIELIARDSQDVVVTGDTGEEASMAYAKGRAPIAAVNMLIMIGLMMFNIVPSVVAVMISALLMVLTGCLRNAEDAYQKINWETVVLIAAMLPMSTALEKTGGVSMLSDTMISTLGEYGPYAIITGFYVITMVLSQFISNTATAVIFAPVAITTAVNLGVSPYPLLLSISIAASMAFATPVATPPNAMVMSAGGYQFKDFVKVGVPLQVFIGIVMIIFIPVFFPF